jgi:hypothetical protein
MLSAVLPEKEGKLHVLCPAGLCNCDTKYVVRVCCLQSLSPQPAVALIVSVVQIPPYLPVMFTAHPHLVASAFAVEAASPNNARINNSYPFIVVDVTSVAGICNVE